MKTYKIANTNMEISKIAYGCMGLGGSWEKRSPLTREIFVKAAESVTTAVEQGITLFDHADIYAGGKSEQVFGKVLQDMRGIRDNIIVQTKCGIRPMGDPNSDSPGRYDFSYEHIINSVNGSLGRLGIEYLDLLLLHRPDPLMEPDEVAKAFDELYREGKVRYYGVSNFNAGQITLLQNSLDQPLVVNQMEINLLHHHMINDGILANQESGSYAAASGLLDYCRMSKILIQAWSPIARGKLFNPASNAKSQKTALARQIAKYAGEKETSVDAVALAWLLKHPAGIQPVIGTTNPQRIINSCKADDIELSREEWYTLFTMARGGAVP